jgi:hypothetical protein
LRAFVRKLLLCECRAIFVLVVVSICNTKIEAGEIHQVRLEGPSREITV